MRWSIEYRANSGDQMWTGWRPRVRFELHRDGEVRFNVKWAWSFFSVGLGREKAPEKKDA